MYHREGDAAFVKQFSYVMTHSAGLHARPVAALAREASRFESVVQIHKDGRYAQLQDVKAMLALGIRCGDAIRITAEGIDEEAAVAAVQQVFVANL